MLDERTYNPDENELTWVDLVDPTADELARVAERFGLHPLALEDAGKHGQRPKLEQYPGHAFIVAHSSGGSEVDLFVGPTWLVSVRERDDGGGVWHDAHARGRFERTKPDCATVGFLLYTILDEIVDDYFDETDRADDLLEQLEQAVFAEEAADERALQEQLFTIRRRLVKFRRSVVPLREVMGALLRREVPWIDERTVVHLQDVYDHVLRAVDVIDAQRELLGNAVDAHLAIISYRMNQVMKRMTSWGAILLGAALVAGIYGMNFEHMPELSWRFGYLWALALMAAITGVGYAYFRRRDWL